MPDESGLRKLWSGKAVPGWVLAGALAADRLSRVEAIKNWATSPTVQRVTDFLFSTSTGSVLLLVVGFGWLTVIALLPSKQITQVIEPDAQQIPVPEVAKQQPEKPAPNIQFVEVRKQRINFGGPGEYITSATQYTPPNNLGLLLVFANLPRSGFITGPCADVKAHLKFESVDSKNGARNILTGWWMSGVSTSAYFSVGEPHELLVAACRYDENLAVEATGSLRHPATYMLLPMGKYRVTVKLLGLGMILCENTFDMQLAVDSRSLTLAAQ